jgi:hypothetical protein
LFSKLCNTRQFDLIPLEFQVSTTPKRATVFQSQKESATLRLQFIYAAAFRQ